MNMSYLRSSSARKRRKSALSGLGSLFSDLAHDIKHAMSLDQKVTLKRPQPMSGLTSGPRGSRISLVALDGDPAIYTAATPCSSIPSGDPYRAPGHQCTATDGSTVMNFDASGNVTAPRPSYFTWGIYGALGYFAYKALLK